jgi:pimeloyl-ACP methyl ester carboxylesterase
MNLFEEAWRNIISPPQIRCKLAALGPRERRVGELTVVRVDVSVLNRNGKKLEGFLFHCPQAEAAETILYLHGNGGSKLEALPLAELIPQFGCNLAAFDLLGCGNSDAGQLSYGVNEVFDIRDML